ncbi:MAG: hypothetical protein HZB51_21165 [Chloroflexi bacterium]|nr:hypothetical protein [Chloroflexota bacterium]
MSKWTDEEISILKENYASKQIDALLQLLPSKTVSSIYHRAFELRLRKPSRPRPEKPGEEQKSNGEFQPQNVKVIEQQRIIKILPYERQVILDFGKSLSIPELKMLLPRRSAKDILQLLDYYHMR